MSLLHMSAMRSSFKFCLFISLSSLVVLTACSDKSKLLNEGKQLFTKGYYDKAAIAFKNAVDLDPKDPEAHYQFAEALTKLGDGQNAANQYLAALAEDPKYDLARLHLGQLLLAANQLDNAQKISKELLIRDSNNLDAKILLANIQVFKNNTDNAITELNSVLHVQPDNIQANLLLATIQLKTGKVESAIESLKKISEKNPTDVSALSLLAKIYLQSNESDKAEPILTSIIKIEPKKLEHRKTLLMYWVAKNQLDKAEQVLKTATEELTDDVNAKILLVEFLFQKRSPEVAMAELLPLIDQYPENTDLRFELIKLEVAQNHADKAEQALKEIIDLDKDSAFAVKAQTQLARLYVATQRTSEAKALNTQILTVHPKETDAVVLRGEIALAERKISEAINDFRSVLADQPQNISVLKLLSAAHLQNNDPVLAKENLQKILAIAPNDEAAAVELANVLVKTGDTEQAVQLIEAVVKEHPKSKVALQGAYSIYSAQKEWDKTQDFAKRMQSAYPDEGVGFYLSGLAYQAQGKLDASVHAFEQALVKQSDAVEPMTQLVKGLLSLKQSDKAISTLTTSLKQQPKNFVFLNMLGSVYMNDKKYEEAISAFNKASIIKPEWSVPYHMIAVAYTALDKKADAIQALTLGVSHTKSNLEVVNDLATIYSSLGEHDKAISVYEEAYKVNPSSLDLLNNLIIYLTEFGKDKTALEKADKLAEPLKKLDNVYSMDTIAWLYYKLGKYTEAHDLLLKVINANLESPSINYHLGMVYYQLKDNANAIEYLQKSLDKKVDFSGSEIAKQSLNTLKTANH